MRLQLGNVQYKIISASELMVSLRNTYCSHINSFNDALKNLENVLGYF